MDASTPIWQLTVGEFIELVDKSHEETQWKDKINPYYDDTKTISYYRKLKNRFWENHENG